MCKRKFVLVIVGVENIHGLHFDASNSCMKTVIFAILLVIVICDRGEWKEAEIPVIL